MTYRILILIIFSSFIHTSFGQNQQLMFEEDKKHLEQIRNLYGDSAKIYNDKLVNISSFYTQDTCSNKFYKDIACLIMENNHIARELYGYDSPKYYQLMNALCNCMNMKFYNQKDYDIYAPAIISNIKELEQLVYKAINNGESFATILLNLYSNYEPNSQLQLKYSMLKFKIAKDKYSKTTTEYRYAIDFLIQAFASNKQYNDVIKYLKKREKEIGINDENYIFLLTNCLNTINVDAPLFYLEFLINKLPKRTKINALSSFHIHIAKQENMKILNLYEKKFITKITDVSQLFEYYKLVGFVLGNNKQSVSKGLEYLLRAERILISHKMDEKTSYFPPVDKIKKYGLYGSMSYVYSTVNQYDKSVEYVLKSINFFKRNFPEEKEFIEKSMHLCSSYLYEFYQNQNSNSKAFSDKIIGFLHSFSKNKWTLDVLRRLYYALAINSDYRFCNYIEKYFCADEENNYYLYDYYLTNAIYMQRDKLYGDAANYYLRAVDCCHKLNRRDLLYLKTGKTDSYVHYLQNAAFCYFQTKNSQLELECYQNSLSDIAKDFGKTGVLYYNVCSQYISALASVNQYENIYKLIDEVIELSMKIYGVGSLEYRNNLIDKVIVLMKLRNYKQCKLLIDFINANFTNIEKEKSLVLLLNQAVCEKETYCYQKAYDNFMQLLRSVNVIEHRIPIILQLADIYYNVKDENKEEILLTIKHENKRIQTLDKVDTLMIYSYYQDLSNSFKYSAPQLSFECIKQASKYTKNDDFETLFRINRQLIDFKKEDIDYVFEKINFNENLLNTQLKGKKNLYFLLQRDKGDFYLRKKDKPLSDQCYRECYNYYTNQSTDLDEIIDFKLHYAGIKRFNRDYEGAINIYYSLKKSLNDQVGYDVYRENILGLIIDCYLELKEINKAMNVYQEYKNIVQEKYHHTEFFGIHYYQSKIYFHDGKINKAKQYLEQASAFAKSELDHLMLMDLQQLFSDK